MKKYSLLIILSLILSSALLADWNPQDPFPFSHTLSAEEAELMATMDREFIETDPPVGDIRPIAEWEPMKAVMIRYPLGIPVALVAAMAEYTPVLCVVSSSQQSAAQNAFNNGGVDMDNVTFMNQSTETYWTRDYGPWFIAIGDEEIGVVNFKYNRPRPTDDEIPMHYADDNDLNWFGMNIEHTGGNYMNDGYSQGVNTDLILDENNQSLDEMNEKFESYLGITNMHTTADPLGDYIKHVDCWGKYLDVDKILISRVPESHPQYEEYEEVAEYFENVVSSYGTLLQVFRADIPGNNTATPYSNSLILNGKVFVPVTGTSYDATAIALYEEAMPGYEIIPIDQGNQGWLNTDALHCRTHELADDQMLYIRHMPIINTPVDQDIIIEADFVAYSDTDLVEDQLILHYQIEGGAYTDVAMINVEGNSYNATIPAQTALTEVGYYISGADVAGKAANHPYIGSPDPHRFFVGTPNISLSMDNMDVVVPAGQSGSNSFEISNDGEIDLNFNLTYSANVATRETVEYEIVDSPSGSSYTYNTYSENNWADFSVTDSGIINTIEIEYQWLTDNYPTEGRFLIESPNGTEIAIGNGQSSGTYNPTYNNCLGEEMNGNWKIWIEDSYGDGGHQASNVTVKFTTLPAEEAWLEVTPTHGTLTSGNSMDIEVNYDATDLENGEYLGTIIISSNDSDNGSITFNVNLTVGETSAEDTELHLGRLGNNYPNPFNPTTTIQYDVSDNSAATNISIYNLKGQKIIELVNDKLSTGSHQIVWNGLNENKKPVASGVYFYKMTNGKFSASKKMILMK